MTRLQQIVDSTPKWLDATIIGAGWLVSFLQPLALIVTIVWGGLQIYGWFEKRRKHKEAK